MHTQSERFKIYKKLVASGTFLYSFIKKLHEKEEKEFESNRELNAKVTS